MSNSLGRRPVALAGLSLLSIGVLASAFAPYIETLMAMRAVTGLGGGMIPPNSMAAVADSVAPSRRAQTVGALMAFAALSSVIGDWRALGGSCGRFRRLAATILGYWFSVGRMYPA